MTPTNLSPLECAKRAHRQTVVPAELDVRILAISPEKRFQRPRFQAPLWVPVCTTCAILGLAVWVFSLKSRPLTVWSLFSNAPTLQQTHPFTVERHQFVSARLPAILYSLQLWENGETGIRSIFDTRTVYQVTVGVELELLSSFAILEKCEDTVTQLAGAVRWHADLPSGAVCMVEAAGWLFSAENATFSMDVSQQEVTVEVHVGNVTAVPRQTSKLSHRLSAGMRATLPAVNTKSVISNKDMHVWTRQKIEQRLQKFAEEHAHEAAAEFITRILPEVENGMRESLLFDLASIYGHYLHDWDRACQTLERLVHDFPSTSLIEGVQSLYSRYRCPPGGTF